MNTEERKIFWDALCKADGKDIKNDGQSIAATIHYPRFLYRYRPVSVSSIDALQTNHLFFSKANYYDDPFDTLIKIDYYSPSTYHANAFVRRDFSATWIGV